MWGEKQGGPPGENLYTSTGGSPKLAIDSFAEEYKKYHPTTGFNNLHIPDSPPNVFHEVGHYTQVLLCLREPHPLHPGGSMTNWDT